jgi:hypothetical protein
MWRWLVLAVLVVMLSAAIPVLSQLLPAPKDTDASIVAPDLNSGGPPPLAIVEGDLTYQFGVMAQDDTGTHEWVLKNLGDGELKLTQGQSTCSCTIASLEKGKTAVVKPGDSTKVKLKWETRKHNGEGYSKQATIETNDPEHQQIVFGISGIVRPPIVRMPPDDTLDFREIPNDKDQMRPVVIFSYDRPEMKILKVTSRQPALIDAALKPLTKDEMDALHIKSGGHKLELTAKPGSNLGTFLTEVVVETDHPKKPELVIPITGKIAGPISPSPLVIRLNRVSGPNGGSERIVLTVHDQEKTQFEVQAKPDKLNVRIAPVETKAGLGNSIRQYILTAEIPPGTSPGQILGNIVLKTDHPKASQVKIPVDVLIMTQ